MEREASQTERRRLDRRTDFFNLGAAGSVSEQAVSRKAGGELLSLFIGLLAPGDLVVKER